MNKNIFILRYEGSWDKGLKEGTGNFSYASGDVFTVSISINVKKDLLDIIISFILIYILYMILFLSLLRDLMLLEIDMEWGSWLRRMGRSGTRTTRRESWSTSPLQRRKVNETCNRSKA